MKKGVNLKDTFLESANTPKTSDRLPDSDRIAQHPMSEKETKKRKRAVMNKAIDKFQD
jgi:hypothetical protein